MTVLEILFHFITAALLLRVLIEPSLVPRAQAHWLIFLGLCVLLSTLVITPYRWQVLPAFLLFAILALVSRRRRRSGRVWRGLGATLSVFILALSAALADQLPVFDLPEPGGPYAVGTFSESMLDETRIEYFDHSGETRRELAIRIWYPADPDKADGYPVRSLWQDLYDGPIDAVVLRRSYLRNVKTHSHIEAPIAQAESQFPLLVYNHGLTGFMEENTQVIEHLVSHGYVVVAIAHPYESMKVHLKHSGTVAAPFNPEFAGAANRKITLPVLVESLLYSKSFEKFTTEFVNTRPGEKNVVSRVMFELLDELRPLEDEAAMLVIVAERLQDDNVPDMLADLPTEDMLAILKLNEYNGESTDLWVEDIQFVLDNLHKIEERVEGFFDSVNTNKLGLFGMSFGGSATIEFCKVDRRCQAGMTFDSEPYGQAWKKPMAVPFLNLYSEGRMGHNDFAMSYGQADYLEYAVAGSEHADFSDASRVMPIMKALDADILPNMGFGGISADRMAAVMRHVSLAFFDSYIKGHPMHDLATPGFPELRGAFRPALEPR